MTDPRTLFAGMAAVVLGLLTIISAVDGLLRASGAGDLFGRMM